VAVRIDLKTSGLFFKNPVGQLHRNIYDVLREAAEIGASDARGQLQPGHGYVSGKLHDSIVARPVKATRSAVRFGGRYRVVAGSAGYEPVRRYQAKVERKYRFMRRAAAAVRSWSASNRHHIESTLARKLS